MSKMKYLRPEEKGRLFCSLDTDGRRHAARNRAIFYLAEYCGLRISEVCSLKIDDYNPATATIYCTRMKNGNDNTLRIIDRRVINAMESYLAMKNEMYKDSEYLFISQRGGKLSRKSLDKIMKYHSERADLSAVKSHFHTLRHTRAVELADYGFDTKDIQWWLGHKRIDTTTIYMQFTTKQQDSIYDRLACAMKDKDD